MNFRTCFIAKVTVARFSLGWEMKHSQSGRLKLTLDAFRFRNRKTNFYRTLTLLHKIIGSPSHVILLKVYYRQTKAFKHN